MGLTVAIPDRYGLRREVGLLGSLSLIVGVMVGSGIFVSPGGVLDRSGSVATAIIIWALSGFVACMGEDLSSFLYTQYGL